MKLNKREAENERRVCRNLQPLVELQTPLIRRNGKQPQRFPLSLSETLICRASSLAFLSGRVSYLSTVPIMMFSFMNTHSQRHADGDYYKPSACALNAVRPRVLKGTKVSAMEPNTKEGNGCRGLDANSADLFSGSLLSSQAGRQEVLISIHIILELIDWGPSRQYTYSNVSEFAPYALFRSSCRPLVSYSMLNSKCGSQWKSRRRVDNTRWSTLDILWLTNIM